MPCPYKNGRRFGMAKDIVIEQGSLGGTSFGGFANSSILPHASPVGGWR